MNPQGAVDLAQFANPQASEALHKYSDVGRGPRAQHHYLGNGPDDAAPGNHTHEDLYDLEYTLVTSFFNNWSNLGNPNTKAKYLKDPFGFVHLSGVVTGGNSPTVFALPPGFLPAVNEEPTFPCARTNGSTWVYIKNSTDVQIGHTGDLWYTLDGISFLAGA